jgi:hypothetical protein
MRTTLSLALAATLAVLSTDAVAFVDETALEARGRLVETGHRLAYEERWHGRQWQYWWLARERRCVLTVTHHGRLERLEPTSETDCDAPAATSAPGRVAQQAMRLLGVRSLLHKSHVRDARRFTSATDVAAFERGYRIGAGSDPAHEPEAGEAWEHGFHAALARRGGPDAPLRSAVPRT